MDQLAETSVIIRLPPAISVRCEKVIRDYQEELASDADDEEAEAIGYLIDELTRANNQ